MTPERTARITSVLNNRQPDLTVILENVHDPHNISAVMRSCDAVGIQEIYVLMTVLPRHNSYGINAAASAMKWLTLHHFDNTAECMAAVRKKYDKVYATHLETDAHSLYELDLTQRVALVFGNEHAGVTKECLDLCDGNFIIPQVGMVQSLNVSVACAVSFYEAFRQRQVKGYYGSDGRLPEGQWKELAKEWRMYE